MQPPPHPRDGLQVMSAPWIWPNNDRDTLYVPTPDGALQRLVEIASWGRFTWVTGRYVTFPYRYTWAHNCCVNFCGSSKGQCLLEDEVNGTSYNQWPWDLSMDLALSAKLYLHEPTWASAKGGGVTSKTYLLGTFLHYLAHTYSNTNAEEKMLVLKMSLPLNAILLPKYQSRTKLARIRKATTNIE